MTKDKYLRVRTTEQKKQELAEIAEAAGYSNRSRFVRTVLDQAVEEFQDKLSTSVQPLTVEIRVPIKREE